MELGFELMTYDSDTKFNDHLSQLIGGDEFNHLISIIIMKIISVEVESF